MVVILSACDIDAPLPDCDYNARLEYWYVFTGTDNEIPDYVDTMNEYLFDADGILRQVRSLEGDSLLAHELTVSPGTYTLVSWGNLDGRSRIAPAIIGQTRLSEIRLEHNDIATESILSPLERGQGVCQSHPNTEPLYYATDILEVPRSGIIRKRINTTHAHALLRVTAKWLRDIPANTKDFAFTLRGIPAAAGFDVAERVNTSVDNRTGEQWIYAIPRMDETTLCDHRADASMRPNRTVTGDLITYRYTDNTRLLFRIWAGDRPLIREVNLTEFFRAMSIPFTRNIRQEFSIVVTIDGDNISVSFAGVSDWEDGGTIGGAM
ncbi:FimB/Mfa2 family fimbrial subunit [Parabacteroides sp. HGS0025]|uniref:FimB/Mfa2 family fimbrial subunit n=1 Tax=Parabacteroides sp. HGS0025 TaxID=1078087 RepID=UPI0012F7965B|nr:FimB/Mfa2 family fimbrial subunit [Parabacteroides sp. HGS0025]